MQFAKSLLIFGLVFSLILSAVNAASFDITTEAIKDRIIVNEFATYKIAVKNNLQVKDEYRIYTLDFPTWGMRTDPIVNPITLELAPGEEGSVEVLIDPLKIKDIGAYDVNVNVRSKVLDIAVPIQLKVTILSTDPLMQGYVPTVITSVGIPDKIDPRKEIPIKIVLNNQNRINYSSMEIRISGNLMQETIATTLDPKEEKTLEAKKTIDPLTAPQQDNVVIAVFAEGRPISQVTKRIDVLEYKDQQLFEEKKGFLKTKSTYRFASNNEDYKGALKVKATLLSSIFSSTEPNARVVREQGKMYYEWEVKLENKEMYVTVTKNFVPLVIALIMVIAVAIFYFAFRSPLTMIKEANNIAKKDEGVSELIVVLHITNRGQSKISEIEVSDYIPGLVGIGSDVPIGSLQPTRVLRHEKKGTTIVKWAIDKLDPSEERVLSYKIESKLPILGSFSLPVAKAEFKASGKKLQKSFSNRLSIDN